MYVVPAKRKENIGDCLLSIAQEEFKRRGDKFQLIVHDDDGSGKLIRYYEERGFKRIEDFLPKGMIYKIR
jgi:ribosomal protein S18 acetylase RimI-like enzyme